MRVSVRPPRPPSPPPPRRRGPPASQPGLRPSPLSLFFCSRSPFRTSTSLQLVLSVSAGLPVPPPSTPAETQNYSASRDVPELP